MIISLKEIFHDKISVYKRGIFEFLRPEKNLQNFQLYDTAQAQNY